MSLTDFLLTRIAEDEARAHSGVVTQRVNVIRSRGRWVDVAPRNRPA